MIGSCITLEELDNCISEFVNAELVNRDSHSTVTWNETYSKCLHRTRDGIYMIGFREYYSIPMEDAVEWLREKKYQLPNELNIVGQEDLGI